MNNKKSISQKNESKREKELERDSYKYTIKKKEKKQD